MARAHVRSERRELVERFSDTPMLVTTKLARQLQPEVYRLQSKGLVGGKKYADADDNEWGGSDPALDEEELLVVMEGDRTTAGVFLNNVLFNLIECINDWRNGYLFLFVQGEVVRLSMSRNIDHFVVLEKGCMEVILSVGSHVMTPV